MSRLNNTWKASTEGVSTAKVVEEHARWTYDDEEHRHRHCDDRAKPKRRVEKVACQIHTILRCQRMQVSKGTTARQYIDDADSPPTKRKCQERSASAHQTGKQLVSVPQWQRANNKADEPTLTKVPVAGSRGPKDTSAKGTGYKHSVSLTNLGWAPTLCGVGFTLTNQAREPKHDSCKYDQEAGDALEHSLVQEHR